jgi:hypothetical protein
LAAFLHADRGSFAGGAERGHTGATGLQTPKGLGGQPAVVNGKVIFEWQGQSARQTESNRGLHIVLERVKYRLPSVLVTYYLPTSD